MSMEYCTNCDKLEDTDFVIGAYDNLDQYFCESCVEIDEKLWLKKYIYETGIDPFKKELTK